MCGCVWLMHDASLWWITTQVAQVLKVNELLRAINAIKQVEVGWCELWSAGKLQIDCCRPNTLYHHQSRSLTSTSVPVIGRLSPQIWDMTQVVGCSLATGFTPRWLAQRSPRPTLSSSVMETPLYSTSLHHAWDLQLQPGLLLVDVRSCMYVVVSFCVSLHIPLVLGYFFSLVSLTVTPMSVGVWLWLPALIFLNRTLSTMLCACVCMYVCVSCACILMVSPVGWMVLMLAFTLFLILWQKLFLSPLHCKVSFIESLTRCCTNVKELFLLVTVTHWLHKT